MGNEKTLDILNEMRADKKAQELYQSMEKPKTLDEAIPVYAQIAEKLGYGITAEDIREAVEQNEARIRLETEKAVSDVELEGCEMARVAGGGDHPQCKDTYSNGWDGVCFYEEICFNFFYLECTGICHYH